MKPVRHPAAVCHRQRRAVITVVVVMLLLFVSAMLAGFVRRAISDRRHTRGQLEYVQAIHLASAALERSQMRHDADPQYRGETWKIPAGVIHQIHSAEVVISISETDVTVTASYPAEIDQPRRFTRKATLSSP